MQAEYRIYEMNKRIASRPEHEQFENSIALWWDAFAHEFFDDDARLSMRNVTDENVPRNFTVGRSLIPRFFRSIFEGGVNDLYFQLTRGQTNLISKEPTANQTPPPPPHGLLFDSDMCTMTTKYGRPMYAIIFTEGQLQIEFTLGDADNSHMVRIRNWIFSIRRSQELIPRSTIAIQQDAQGIEQISKNITKGGVSMHTLNFLKMSAVLEPMQELMSRNKMTQMSPRECLKVSASQKLNRMNAMSSAAAQPGGGGVNAGAASQAGCAPPSMPGGHQSRIGMMNDELISIKNEPGLMNRNIMNPQQAQQAAQQQQQQMPGMNNPAPPAPSLTPGNLECFSFRAFIFTALNSSGYFLNFSKIIFYN